MHKNIFPEYLKLLQIFWIQNNFFFENTNFSTKIQDGCWYVKKWVKKWKTYFYTHYLWFLGMQKKALNYFFLYKIQNGRRIVKRSRKHTKIFFLNISNYCRFFGYKIIFSIFWPKIAAKVWNVVGNTKQIFFLNISNYCRFFG